MRKFNFDPSQLATVQVVLDAGLYAGILKDPSIVRKDASGKNIPLVDMVEIKEYEKGSNVGKPTGKYKMQARVNYNVELTSKKAKHVLGKDKPIIFPNMFGFSLVFDENFFEPDSKVDSFIDLEKSHTFGAFLEALGLKDIDFGDEVGNIWAYDENIEVPAHLTSVPYIVDKLNALNYTKELLTLVCDSAKDKPVLANVTKVASYANKDVMVNQLNSGINSCGLVAYKEGSENDLEG